MPNEMGSQAYNFEFIIRIVTLVIIVVNSLVTIASVWIWRSFISFKNEIKEIIRNYIDKANVDTDQVRKTMEELENKVHEHDITLVRLEQSIEQQKALCNERRYKHGN